MVSHTVRTTIMLSEAASVLVVINLFRGDAQLLCSENSIQSILCAAFVLSSSIREHSKNREINLIVMNVLIDFLDKIFRMIPNQKNIKGYRCGHELLLNFLEIAFTFEFTFLIIVFKDVF